MQARIEDALLVALLALLITLPACATTPDTYCKGGYVHTYSYNYGYRQVFNERSEGIPCEKDTAYVRL